MLVVVLSAVGCLIVAVFLFLFLVLFCWLWVLLTLNCGFVCGV